jgi:hypothetical protein
MCPYKFSPDPILLPIGLIRPTSSFTRSSIGMQHLTKSKSSKYSLFLLVRLHRRSLAVPLPIYVPNYSTLVRLLRREDGTVDPSKTLFKKNVPEYMASHSTSH